MRYLAAYFLAHQLLYILQQGLKAENIIGIYVWIYNTPQIQTNNFGKTYSCFAHTAIKLLPEKTFL